MHYVHAVAMLAVLQYLFFGALVGMARGKYGVKAPAVTGDERFERVYRVQVNTLELLVAFFPALYAAAYYWPAPYVAAAGAVYLIGRMIDWRAYVRDPAQREIGFVLSLLPVFALAVAVLAGALLQRSLI
jgi:glutathione S-transferase